MLAKQRWQFFFRIILISWVINNLEVSSLWSFENAGNIAQLTNIKVKELSGQLQVNVVTTTQVKYLISHLDDPNRILLKILNVEKLWPEDKLSIDNENLYQIRVAQHDSEVWVVLDLRKKMRGVCQTSSNGIRVTLLDKKKQSSLVEKKESKKKESLTASFLGEGNQELINPSQEEYKVVNITVKDIGPKTRLVVTTDGLARYKIKKGLTGDSFSLFLHKAGLAWENKLRFPVGVIEDLEIFNHNINDESQVEIIGHMLASSSYLVFNRHNQIILEINNPGLLATKKKRTSGELATLLSIDFQNADLVSVLRALAQNAGYDIVITPGVQSLSGATALVTVTINEQTFKTILDFILKPRELAYAIKGNTLRVGLAKEFTLDNKIFTLKNLEIKGSNIEKSLKTALTKNSQGQIVIDDQANRIMVSAIPSDMLRIEEIINKIDVQSRLVTRTFKLNYIHVSNMFEALQPLLSSLGSIKKNELGNSLVVTDIPGKLKRIAEVVNRLDVKVKQIKIEAKVVEFILANNEQGASAQDLAKGNYIHKDTNLEEDASKKVSEDLDIRVGNLKSDVNLAKLLKELKSDGLAEVIAKPQLITLNNQVATLIANQRKPYMSLKAGKKEIAYFDLPITLEVVPQITYENKILLKPISLSITTLDTRENPPITIKRSTKTQILVKNNETVVLGSIMQDRNVIQKTRVPVLGNIPLLGILFSGEEKIIEKSEIVIYLTTTIID